MGFCVVCETQRVEKLRKCECMQLHPPSTPFALRSSLKLTFLCIFGVSILHYVDTTAGGINEDTKDKLQEMFKFPQLSQVFVKNEETQFAVRIIGNNKSDKIYTTFKGNIYADVSLVDPIFPAELENKSGMVPSRIHQVFTHDHTHKDLRLPSITLSHRKCWMEFLIETQFPFSFILEDKTFVKDISTTAAMGKSIEIVSLLTRDPVHNDWDIIQLGYCNWDPEMGEMIMNDSVEIHPKTKSQSQNYTKGGECMHAYAVSRKGAKSLLQWNRLYDAVDVQIMNLLISGTLKVYRARPIIYCQDWSLKDVRQNYLLEGACIMKS